MDSLEFSLGIIFAILVGFVVKEYLNYKLILEAIKENKVELIEKLRKKERIGIDKEALAVSLKYATIIVLILTVAYIFTLIYSPTLLNIIFAK